MKNALILLLSIISLQSVAQNDFVISCWVSINDLEDVYIDSLTQHYDLNISNMTIIHDEDSLYKELTHGDYFCTGYHCFKYGENNVTSFVREEYGLNDNKMKDNTTIYDNPTPTLKTTKLSMTILHLRPPNNL